MSKKFIKVNNKFIFYNDCGSSVPNTYTNELTKSPNGSLLKYNNVLLGGRIYPSIPGATFSDGTFLTWEELQLSANGTKYGYDATTITNTSLGAGFQNCTTLKSITTPTTLTSMVGSAFSYCSNLQAAHLCGTLSTPLDPNSLFLSCSNLETVQLDVNLSKFGAYMFYGCSKLKTVNVPSNISTLDTYAFYGCASLKSFELPFTGSFGVVGYGAFYNCSKLEFVNLQDSVASIGAYAFGKCVALKTVEETGLVQSIGNSAFSGCTHLSTISFNVTSIGNYAFSGCSSLRDITFSRISSIGQQAFYNCSNLTYFEIPSGSSLTSISYAAFYGCTNLSTVVLPNTITSIGDYAFGGCTYLQNIRLPSNLTTIGSYAFYYCFYTNNFNIPASVTSIGDCAFLGCGSDAITVNRSNTYYSSVDGVLYNKAQTQLIFCPNEIVNVSIPDTVTTIVDDAFFYCYLLENVVIPSGVTTIGEEVFMYCESLPTITIPSSVTTIGADAFAECTSLTDIYIDKPQDSITGSPWGATNATVHWQSAPEPVYPTDPGAIFTDGEFLTWSELQLTENGTKYGYDASTITNTYLGYGFQNCATLKSITSPDTITEIDHNLFEGCTNLQAVRLCGDSSTYFTLYSCFYSCQNLELVQLDINLDIIGFSMFSDCTKLKSVNIPDTVEEIQGAFENCTSLPEISIPSSVTYIDNYAFDGCTSLTDIYIDKATGSISGSPWGARDATVHWNS